MNTGLFLAVWGLLCLPYPALRLNHTTFRLC